MSDEIVVDVETQKLFQDIGVYDPSKLGLSVVCCYSSKEDKYYSFLENEISGLWPLMEGAQRIIGYNIVGFDLNVLAPYYIGKMDQFPTFDLMLEVAKSLPFKPKLNDIARATLGVAKLGDGFGAIEYYKKGDFDKLREYCLKDVELTWKIYEYGRKNGKLMVMDLFGKPFEFKVNFPPIQDKGNIDLTLPF